jgi:hypothetical protein
MPIASNATPVSTRREPMRRCSTAASRKAAIGATRPARRADTWAAASVTATPTMSPIISEIGLMVSPPAGNAPPKASNRPFNRPATPKPTTTPTAAATMPTTTASMNMRPRTWRRDAPTARSRPSSRVRCATVMLKVLLMLKVATTSAMPANTTSMVRRRSRNVLLMASIRSLVNCWPVIA